MAIIFPLLFREKTGITLHNFTFEKIVNQRDTAARIITDVLLEAPSLQLLLVVLQGGKETENFYGRFFCLFSSMIIRIVHIQEGVNFLYWNENKTSQGLVKISTIKQFAILFM